MCRRSILMQLGRRLSRERAGSIPLVEPSPPRRLDHGVRRRRKRGRISGRKATTIELRSAQSVSSSSPNLVGQVFNKLHGIVGLRRAMTAREIANAMMRLNPSRKSARALNLIVEPGIVALINADKGRSNSVLGQIFSTDLTLAIGAKLRRHKPFHHSLWPSRKSGPSKQYISREPDPPANRWRPKRGVAIAGLFSWSSRPVPASSKYRSSRADNKLSVFLAGAAAPNFS